MKFNFSNKLFSSVLFLIFLIISPAYSTLKQNNNVQLDKEKNYKFQLDLSGKLKSDSPQNTEFERLQNIQQVNSEQSKVQQISQQQEQKAKTKTIINMDFKIDGELTAEKIIADKFVYTGPVRSPDLKTKNVEVEEMSTNSLKVNTIIAKNKDIVINGNIVLTNEIAGSNINLEGQQPGQWFLVTHDDFETEKSLQGWSDKRVNHCKNDKNTHLGGYCNFAGNKVTKVFNNLPPHKIVRINALYHMIDYWQGEEGYMLVDGVKKWTKRGTSPKNGIDLCGGKSNDPAFNINIDVIVEHYADSIELTFGSTLTGDPCLHSFAVDDVMIYTKN